MASTFTQNQLKGSSSDNTSYRLPFIILTSLFFMWGFITAMNDVLIPHLRQVFSLSVFQGMLVQFAFFGAYFIGSLVYFFISLSQGDPILKIGYKNGIIIGLLVAALGCALFYPAAQFAAYGFFLGALFCLGLGLTILQIAANPYVAILGSPQTASSRLNLSQGFNSLGTTIAPVIGGYLIFNYFASESGISADSVKTPYLIMAAFFVLLAILIKVSHLPKIEQGDEKVEKNAGALQFSQLVFGVGAVFMYVGGEVTIGSILINFFRLPQIAGLEEMQATTYLAFYWGGAMTGRFIGSISLSQIQNLAIKYGSMVGVSVLAFFFLYALAYKNSNLAIGDVMPFAIFLVMNLVGFGLGKSLAGRTLGIFASVVIGLLIITIFGTGKMAFWSVIAIGLFNSIMWSNIFTLAIDGLGKYTSQGSSLLVMAILGGALVPLLQGQIADMLATADNVDAGIQASFFVPIFCYAYIAWYGFVGSKPKKF